MGFRFRRRIKIAPGVTLNLSKSGVSTSLGPRGARVTFGPRGTTKTVGLPGTGLSYTDISKPTPRPDSGSGGPVLLVFLVLLFFLWLFS